MVLTPLDIENKKFRKKPFGYSELEVEEFLTKIVEDYEKLYKENIELKDKIAVLNEGIQHYKAIEETLQNTLLVAQSTGEDIKKNAYAKAENILKEAEMKASQMIADANQEVSKINYRYEDLKRSFGVFKAKIESLIYAQLDMMKDIASKIED
ncbi:MAG: cell division initiation protein [Petroclostridium sp.]|nr:DivIVA domain-containing protein [Petroclostridium xylanilyticum]MBZ4646556.1 DivIVA family protein [Clostridia bacterium]MDK2810621.1 cell division initiation protein [Petroclostridium sp.]